MGSPPKSGGKVKMQEAVPGLRVMADLTLATQILRRCSSCASVQRAKGAE